MENEKSLQTGTNQEAMAELRSSSEISHKLLWRILTAWNAENGLIKPQRLRRILIFKTLRSVE